MFCGWIYVPKFWASKIQEMIEEIAWPVDAREIVVRCIYQINDFNKL